MKKIVLLLLVCVLAGCVSPDVVKQDGKDYIVEEWNGGDFYHTAYKFKGGFNFDEAVGILKEWGEVVKKRGVDGELSLGIFPDFKNWDLGMISAQKLDFESISGYKIEKKVIPAGQYATMKLKGHPENMYTLYNSFKKRLIKDGYAVESSVYEIYTYDTFNNDSIPITERVGMIRYKVSRK